MITHKLSQGEGKINRIGGRLARDYYAFKSDIEYINESFFELFSILHLTENIELIIKTLNDGLHNLCSVFIEKVILDIEAGKIPKDKFLSPETKKKVENLPPEEGAKTWERGTKTKLGNIYKDVYAKYLKKHNIYSLVTKHSRDGFKRCSSTLFVTPSRIEIDVEKFIEVYMDFIAADESETRKIHEQAAENVNRFFNGAVEITQKELSKYFILEYGTVKVNPASVNTKDYARLGARTYKKKDKDGQKKK